MAARTTYYRKTQFDGISALFSADSRTVETPKKCLADFGTGGVRLLENDSFG